MYVFLFLLCWKDYLFLLLTNIDQVILVVTNFQLLFHIPYFASAKQ